MKFGANTFIWESPFSSRHGPALAKKVKQMGFDILEIAFEDPALIDLGELGATLHEEGLEALVCGAFGEGRDISSDDPAVRESGRSYIRQLVDAAATLGSSIVCGPMYSQTGKARLLPQEERAAERQRAIDGLKDLADYAGRQGVRLALEPLNRFETDMINTVEQAVAFLEQIDNPYVGLHLDTFHMHLEEKSSADAIVQAGEHVFHVHACENDRGVPGTGQVAWSEVAGALRTIDYRGPVVIESFTPKVRTIAQAVSLWRPVAPDEDTIARDGLRFLRRLFTSTPTEDAKEGTRP